MRTKGAGKKLPHPWVKDASGNVTDNPSVVFADPPGSILPLGGVDAGHKGYALGLLVEALTAGLGGYGRADEAEAWGASVFVQVIDPEAFGGAAPFTREMGWLADACKNSKPAPGGLDVRLPGQAGLERRRQALAEGVELYPGIMNSLTEWAAKYGIDPPPPAV